MSKIALIKCIDRTVGRALLFLFSAPSSHYGDTAAPVKRILFIRPGGIGDAVLLIPAITAILDFYPHPVIDVLAEKRNGDIFSLSSDIATIYRYDRPKEFMAVMRNRYDAVIDTEQWHRLSAVVARMTKAHFVIGFATNEREKLFTHRISYSHDDHEIDSFARLIKPFIGNAALEIKPPFLTVPTSAMGRADVLIRSLHGRQFVTVCPGGSIRERQWGPAPFRAVATKLIERGYGVAVVGGREDVALGKKIAERLENAIDVCGKLSLIETAGLLKRAELLITGDSGIMHLAYGLGVPTVSLFGSGREKKWAPRGEHHIVINKHIPCSPCTKFGYTPQCKKDAECMKLITPEEVFEKAVELLEGKTHASD